MSEKLQIGKHEFYPDNEMIEFFPSITKTIRRLSQAEIRKMLEFLESAYKSNVARFAEHRRGDVASADPGVVYCGRLK